MSTHESPTGVDVREHGAPRDGQPQVMDRRLFMQLLAFRPASGRQTHVADELARTLTGHGQPGVIYADVNDPQGLALLTWSDRPSNFVTHVRPALNGADLDMQVRTELTMFGRTYATGYEPDLEYSLLRRPVETALNPAWPWAIWYPLRRTGGFERLEPRERGGILREHAEIGKAYGVADLAHDIRLACHGLDQNDNEFVIGLIGKELHPLSHVVQAMRKTRQTSEYIGQMGPFFVGYAVHRIAG